MNEPLTHQQVRARIDDAHRHGRSILLSGAKLEGVSLQGINLRGAWLQGACLAGADLQQASLSYAYLQHADLRTARRSDHQSIRPGASMWRTAWTAILHLARPASTQVVKETPG